MVRLIVGAIVATALILGGMYAYNNVAIDTGGLSYKQTVEAKNITLSHSFIKLLLDTPNSTYAFGNIRRPGPDYYSYSEEPARTAVVPIHIENDYAKMNMSITVDLEKQDVTSIYYDEKDAELTYKQQTDAIRIALQDPFTQAWMKDLAVGSPGEKVYFDGYIIGGVHLSGFVDYGYVDPFGFYVDVPLTLNSFLPMAVKYLVVTVNLADNTTAIRKESWGEGLMGSVVTATIPPGQSFYREYNFPHPFHGLTISNGFELGDTNYLKVDQQPEDLYLYPVAVDRENLNRLKNGSPYSGLSYARYGEHGNKWYVYAGYGDYYLVLKNTDTHRAANVTLPYRAF